MKPRQDSCSFVVSQLVVRGAAAKESGRDQKGSWGGHIVRK